jgi:hypothetical protein
MNTQTRRKFIEIVSRRIKPGSGSSAQFLKYRTWNRDVTQLSNIITIPYAIVGGVATRLYMPERMTYDLDILIQRSQANIAYNELTNRQSKQIGELTIGGTAWELADGTLLDVIASDRPWVKNALLNPRRSPDNQPVIDLPYLVLMKLEASRTTDISDISRMLGQANDDELNRVRSTIQIYDPNSLEDLESLIQLGKLEML